MPLFFTIGPAVFDLYIVIFCLFFLTLNFINKEKINIISRLLIILIIILVYINIVSYFSEYQEVAFSRSVSFLRYLFVIIVISNLAIKYNYYLKYTFFCSFALTLFIVIDIIYQYFFGFDIFNNKSHDYRLSGPFGEELIAGQVLFLLSMPTLMFSFVYFTNKKLQMFIFIFLIILILIGIFFSGQRTSMFNFLVSLFLFLFIFKKQIYIKPTQLIILLLLSISGIFLFFNSVFYRFIIITYKQISNLLNTSYSAFYETGINVWLDNFWIGAGLKNYRFVCEDKLYFSNYTGQPCANHPHNSYIEILSELGIIGFILFLTLFIYFLKLIVPKIIFSNDKAINYSIPFFITLIPIIFPILPSGSFFTNTHSVPFWVYFSISLSIFYKEEKFN